MTNKPEMVKVWAPARDSSFGSEGLWAAVVGPGEFELANVPVMVKGISRRDVVSAALDDGLLTITGVIRGGGHSTIQVLLRHDQPDGTADALKEAATGLGGGAEGMNARMFAIDVPPTADKRGIIDLLEAAFLAEQVWYEIVAGDVGREYEAGAADAPAP